MISKLIEQVDPELADVISKEMEIIAKLIAQVLTHPDDEDIIGTVSSEVQELCQAFPLYGQFEGGS